MKYCHSPLFFRSILFSLFLFFWKGADSNSKRTDHHRPKAIKNSNSKSSEIKTFEKKSLFKGKRNRKTDNDE